MDDDDVINISTELWDDLDDIKDNCHLSFDAPFTSGFRFRYQSEIDKKSFSLLKSNKNATPMLNVISTDDNAVVQIELVTNTDRSSHFNMFYEVPKDKMSSSSLHQGVFVIRLPCIGQYKIRLDSLGIRKMKNKEALPHIKQNHPEFNDSQAKAFFNQNKDIVRLKATLFQHELPACEIYSEIIKSQISKENKSVKIKHLAPKTVAEIGEELIIVLEKKITTEDFQAGIMFDKDRVFILSSVDQDGQTFIFRLPKIDCPNPIDGRFFMRCGDSEDQKPIKFLPVSPEQRKRKSNEPSNINCLPLKRSNQENIPQPLYPESGMRDMIQTDGIQPIPMDLDDIQNLSNNVNNYRNDNDSCKDSGINSGEHSSDNGDEMISISDESDEEVIEIEGFKRNRNQRNDYIPEVINVQAKDRTADSRLDINISNAATKKILTEVARIGHDFAFGKSPDDLFERIEKQLPVVFTLQDDVGDTPLNNAILKGNVEHAFKILQIVRTNCPWAIDLVNTSGHSALILSPACDVPPELIEKLLSAGCKLDLWDDTGKSAIIYAIEYQNVKALEVLLKHAKHFDLKNVLKRHETSYYTPLQLAIMHGFKKGIEMLLNLKTLQGNNFLVNVNETGLMNEETALHIAVSHDSDLEIIEMLLNRPDIDINQELSNKTTALHVANKMKFFKISGLLKKHNAIDLPTSEVDTCESDEVDEEIDEMEFKFCDSNQNCSDIKPIVEMNSSESVETNIGVIIDSLKQLSIKGEVKSKLIEILVSSDGPTLSISDIQKIVKPTFKAMFNKYSNSSENINDIRETLCRFNCLPNSCGQLIDCLKNINRFDLINKIEKNWGRVV